MKSQTIASIAYGLIILVILLYGMQEMGGLLKPLVFAVLLALALLPIQHFYESKIKSRILCSFLTLLTVIIPLYLVGSLVVAQFREVIRDLPNIRLQLEEGYQDLLLRIQEILPESVHPYLNDAGAMLLESAQSLFGVLGTGLTAGVGTVGSIAIMFLYLFFILWYRPTLKNVFYIQVPPAQRRKMRRVTRRMRDMLKSYLSGLFIVIIVLGVINSVGLYLIGIGYPAFWGFLAASLTVIPYIGTTIGGTLPFLYALATTGTLWQPVAVVIFYAVVQQLEGNLITPKIVGDKIKINPLAAIIGLLIGGSIWGIAGIILSLPVLAVIRIMMQEIPALMPLSVLLSSDIHQRDKEILEIYDDDAHRLRGLLPTVKKYRRASHDYRQFK